MDFNFDNSMEELYNVIIPYQLLAVYLLIYLFIKLSKVIKSYGSEYIMAMGVWALILTGINDTLYEYGVIITGSLHH